MNPGIFIRMSLAMKRVEIEFLEEELTKWSLAAWWEKYGKYKYAR